MLEDLATGRISLIRPIIPGSFVWVASEKEVKLGKGGVLGLLLLFLLLIYILSHGYICEGGRPQWHELVGPENITPWPHLLRGSSIILEGPWLSNEVSGDSLRQANGDPALSTGADKRALDAREWELPTERLRCPTG